MPLNSIDNFALHLKMSWYLVWRRQSGVAAGGLFVGAASFAIFLALQAIQGSAELGAVEWIVLFWTLFLFMSLYVGGTLAEMPYGQILFYFLIAPPLVLWGARVVHNFAVLLILGTFALALHVLWMGNPVAQWGPFIGVVALACLGFSALFTTTALMVARLEAQGRLFVLLSLPLVVPLCVFCVRASHGCLVRGALGAGLSASLGAEMSTGLWPLAGFVALLVGLGVLLFPYIWKL